MPFGVCCVAVKERKLRVQGFGLQVSHRSYCYKKAICDSKCVCLLWQLMSVLQQQLRCKLLCGTLGL